jgi:succinate-semialdehyde dehydrogenase/glutarate-semialdehyde dehydrogenase
MHFINQLFIGGAWTEGAGAQRFPVLNPADGTELTTFAAAEDADCDAAVDAAAAALPGWRDWTPRARSEVLRATFEMLRDDRDQLAELIVHENGKSFADALGEADYATEFFRWFAEEAVRIGGEYRLSPGGDKRIIVTRDPIGVALLVTPWNYPAAMATRKLAPALAAGCTTVLKPARETPLTAAYIVDTLRRAGLPSGAVNLVTPVQSGHAVARMLHHPAVRKLSFTGSTEVGRILLKEAADTVTSTSMELGGNAPLIVLPDADLDLAVEASLVAKLRNGGAACTAANRFYVHRSILADYETRMTAALKAVRVGPGIDRSNSLGSLVSPTERQKVHELVEGAVNDGARLVLGGAHPQRSGSFYPPTLLSDVTQGSTITATEIFGPVVAIVPYDDVDEAIRMANDTIYGLVAYVVGGLSSAMRVAHKLDVGMVAVNRGVLSDPAAPFGGTKQSGIGREGSTEGILEFLEEKYIGLTAGDV